MRIIEPDVQFESPVDGEEILRKIERCGRVCYKSEENIQEDSAENFVRGLIKRGHESVLEHASISLRFICDRGVTHEMVRHRLASYSQESTRYCNYSKGRFGNEITVIKPCFLEEDKIPYDEWYNACLQAEESYNNMLAAGSTPRRQEACCPIVLKRKL